MLRTRMTSISTMTIGALIGLLAGCKASGQPQAPSVAADPVQQAPIASGPTPLAGQNQPAMATSWAPRRAAPANDAARGTCPVTGAELGSMGRPIPVAVRGKVVYVCCAGCVDKLLANPDRYLSMEGSGYAPSLQAQSYGQRTVSRAGNACCESGARSSPGPSASSGCGGGCCSE